MRLTEHVDSVDELCCFVGSVGCASCEKGTFGATTHASACVLCDAGLLFSLFQLSFWAFSLCVVLILILFRETRSISTWEWKVLLFTVPSWSIHYVFWTIGMPTLSCGFANKLTWMITERNLNFLRYVYLWLGQFQPSNGSNACLPCPNGYSTDFAAGLVLPLLFCIHGANRLLNPVFSFFIVGQSFCSQCLAGTFSLSGYDHCVSCAMGTSQSNGGSAACLPCRFALPFSCQWLWCISSLAPIFTSQFELACFHFCCMFSPGYYQDELKQVTCKPCVSGYFASLGGSTTCSPCALGLRNHKSDDHISFLTTLGKYNNNTGAQDCLACPQGTYSNIPAQAQCVPCGAGWIATSLGSTVCSECDAGSSAWWVNGAMQIDGKNVGAQIGTFSNATISIQCTKCPAGTFGEETHASVCANCVAGKFGPYAGLYEWWLHVSSYLLWPFIVFVCLG